ncbi:MAG: 4-hydroxyphenylpyruvate dioxygenase [Chloracidobacterium sp.]|nr:4-hydroxyphenylpyruvate dioxygenase [Chloracidobacterium sp.]MDW8216091.1 4-hydroxyphenylpyruvate dioxygenase [Acidobacteriota bacterium]
MSAPREAIQERAPLAVVDFDHVEFYVGNAKQAAHFYRTAFGFDIVGYRGPETGVRDQVSYALRHGTIHLIITGALTPDHPVTEHVRRHGDGVYAVAFRTPDAKGDFEQAVARGAKALRAPVTLSDAHGTVQVAEIAAYGDTIHRFVTREHYTGAFLPGFEPRVIKAAQTGFLHRIDHVVANVGWHEMETWVKFYEDIFGFFQFRHFDEKDISTEYTALRSKVMASPSLAIKLPINEPAEGKKRSQIEEYVDFYGSPGVQHIAIATSDIVRAVAQLRANGVEFQSVPPGYYDAVTARVGEIEEDLAALRDLNILVDRDDQGYLLQIFTKPLQDRPTVFFEIIQRKGSESFGKGNFKALFEAIEQDQAARGTL